MSRFAGVKNMARSGGCHTCMLEAHLAKSDPEEAKDFKSLIRGPVSKQLVQVMNQIARDDDLGITFSYTAVRRHRDHHLEDAAK